MSEEINRNKTEREENALTDENIQNENLNETAESTEETAAGAEVSEEETGDELPETDGEKTEEDSEEPEEDAENAEESGFADENAEDGAPENAAPIKSKKKLFVIIGVCAAALVVIISATLAAVSSGKNADGSVSGSSGSAVSDNSSNNGENNAENGESSQNGEDASNPEKGKDSSKNSGASNSDKSDSENSGNSSSSDSSAAVSRSESKKLTEKSSKLAVEYSSEYNSGDMASFTKKIVYSYQAVMPAATGLYKSEDDYYAKTYSCKDKADYCNIYKKYHKSLIQGRFGEGYKAEPTVKSVKTLNASELGFVKDYMNAFFETCGLKAADYVDIDKIKQIDIVECSVKLSGKDDSVTKTEIYAVFTIGNKQKIFVSNNAKSVNDCMKTVASLPDKQKEMKSLAAGSLKTQNAFNKYFYVFN